MESRAKLLGHPIHPMLIVLPLGLFIAAVVFDALYLWRGSPTFATVAYWNIAAASSAVFSQRCSGLIDWFAIPAGTRAKRIGLLHGGANVVVVADLRAGLADARKHARHRTDDESVSPGSSGALRWAVSRGGLAASWSIDLASALMTGRISTRRAPCRDVPLDRGNGHCSLEPRYTRAACPHSPRTALRMEGPVIVAGRHTRASAARASSCPGTISAKRGSSGRYGSKSTAIHRGRARRALLEPHALAFTYIYPELTEFGGGGSGQSGDDVSTDAEGIPHRALSLRATYALSIAGLTVSAHDQQSLDTPRRGRCRMGFSMLISRTFRRRTRASATSRRMSADRPPATVSFVHLSASAAEISDGRGADRVEPLGP